jgi:alpha-galactosidase
MTDAQTFASWGVDYLKYDGCNVPVPSGQTQEQAYRNAYSAMSTALATTGRPIVFSESAPAYFCCEGNPTWYSVLEWLPQYGQLWREGWDIAVHGSANRWSSVLTNYGYNVPLSRYAGPNHWNDPDFLITGDGITDEESRSQMALWAMMAAPLILSVDVAALTPAQVAITGNADLIAVDRDSLGVQAGIVSQNGSADILARPLSGGRRAVALFNRGSSTATLATTTANIGFPGGSGCSFTLKNLWTGATTSTTSAISVSVPAHGTAIFTVTPSAGCGAVQPAGQLTGIAGKCADDTGSSTTDGSQIILFGCTGNANQRWVSPGDGTLRTLGKCLTEAGTADGSSAVLSTCTGSTGQQWTYAVSGTLKNVASGKCLDVYGGGSADLTKLVIWPCGSHQINQTWSLPV